VMDCEGCEYDLLRPDLAPLLATCDYIVELHDKAKALTSRFTEVHEIQLVASIRRNSSEFSVLQKLNTEERRIALEEVRLIPIQWAVMVAKHQRKQPLRTVLTGATTTNNPHEITSLIETYSGC